MVESSSGVASNDVVDAVLIGGPEDIPRAVRSCKAARGDRDIKIAHRGGYEHFECQDRQYKKDESGAVRFFWTMRTKIAE